MLENLRQRALESMMTKKGANIEAGLEKGDSSTVVARKRKGSQSRSRSRKRRKKDDEQGKARSLSRSGSPDYPFPPDFP